MAKAPKRASKRVSTKQRVKVDKKIKEAHRKQRRDAKKNPTWKSKKKADPGIPNSFPFKEQLLDEMHMRREREEQRKLDEREKRLAAKRGKKVGGDEESEEEEEDEVDAEVEVGSEEGSPVRSGPLHAPLFAGSLETLLDDDEVKNVVLALDARDPSAWRCPPVEKLAESKGKQVHLAITRADLVPVEALISHIHALSASTSLPVHPVSVHSQASITSLTTALRSQGGGSAVVGFEHSGRSTLAMMLLQEMGGDVPAVKFYDTNHLLPTKANTEGAEDVEDEEDEEDDDLESFKKHRSSALRILLRNKGKVEKVKDPLPLLWALMPLVAQTEDLQLLYNVPAFGSYAAVMPAADLDEEARAAQIASELAVKVVQDSEEFLIGLAKVQGRTKKKGIPDISAAARVVLRDWSAGTLGYYTMASGWSKLPKSEREEISNRHKAELTKQGLLGSVLQSRKEWRKTFAEVQKTRRDLHASPAIGELRLKPAGEAAVGGRDAEVFDFWRSRQQVVDIGNSDEEDMEGWEEVADEDDDDEEEEEEEDEEAAAGDGIFEGLSFDGDGEDEELDSDVLVPDSDDEDVDSDLAADEEDEEEKEEVEDLELDLPRKKKATSGNKAGKTSAAAAAAAPPVSALSHKDKRQAKKVTFKGEEAPKSSKPAKRVRVVEPTRAEKRGRR